MKKNPVTMHTVAERAGVSVASVSRLINGLVVKPDTEAQILLAIEELDYQPNYAARVLKVRKSNQISVSFADIGNPAYIAITRGISSILQSNNLRLILSNSISSSEEIVQHINSLQTGYADGLIIAPIVHTSEITAALKRLRIPAVIIGSLPKTLKLDNIEIDSRQGVKLALQKFISGGRQKIGYLGGPTTTNPGYRRHASFLKEMAEADQEIDKDRIFIADDFTSSSGEKIIRECKALDFDALLCANDLLAAGAMHALSIKGISIPRDVAIIGMDNTDLCNLLSPTLTSIDLRAEERGKLAANLLLERISNPNREFKRINLLPDLIVRDSA